MFNIVRLSVYRAHVRLLNNLAPSRVHVTQIARQCFSIHSYTTCILQYLQWLTKRKMKRPNVETEKIVNYIFFKAFSRYGSNFKYYFYGWQNNECEQKNKTTAAIEKHCYICWVTHKSMLIYDMALVRGVFK